MSDYNGKIRKQNSVFFFSGREEIPKPYTDFYVNMFLEDISRSIVPLKSSSLDDDGLKLEGGDAHSEQLIAEAVDGQGQNYGSFGWGVSEFLRLAASEMCAFDQTAFEIAYLEDPVTLKTDGFVFFHIDNRQIERKWGKLYQKVPVEEARKKGVASMIELPLEQMLIFSLPNALKEEVRKLRRALTRLSENRLGANFLEMNNLVPNYDFKAHERSLNIALAQCCTRVGWDARGSFREKTSSYMTVYLFLKWQLFQIEIRKVLVDLFNGALDRVRIRVPLKGRIVLADTPTTDEVTSALGDLTAGRDTFIKIMDRLNR
jgi:hypothetical protein